MDETLVLTPSALLSFLLQITELEGKNIDLNEANGQIEITIGDSKYVLEPGTELSEVDAEVVDTFDEINEEGYTEVSDEVVEGGILKELVKTLAVGGLVRLTKSVLLD